MPLMKTLVAKIPERLFNEISAEAKQRNLSRSEIVRERLVVGQQKTPGMMDVIGDLIGAVDDNRLPRDLSARKKHYLKKGGYGLNGPDRRRITGRADS